MFTIVRENFPKSRREIVINAYRTTRRQTDSRSVNSRTGQLADSEFLQIIELLYTVPCLYTKPNPNHNCNPIEYWQRINSVICPK